MVDGLVAHCKQTDCNVCATNLDIFMQELRGVDARDNTQAVKLTCLYFFYLIIDYSIAYHI